MSAPDPEPPRSSPHGRTLAQFASGHPGEVGVIAAASAYAFGYVNLRLAAAGLGISLLDLGLTTNDYLMSAATWAILWSPFVIGYVGVQRLAQKVGWRSLTGVVVVAGAAGVALVAVLAATSISLGAAVGTLFATGLAAAAGWWLAGPSLSVVLTVAVAVMAMVLPYSIEWGRQVAEHPEMTRPALWLEIVVAVEEGTAEFASGAECVLRISEGVYVASDGVRVEPAGVPFRPGDCPFRS